MSDQIQNLNGFINTGFSWQKVGVCNHNLMADQRDGGLKVIGNILQI